MKFSTIFNAKGTDVVILQHDKEPLTRRDLNNLRVLMRSYLQARGIMDGSRIGINIENAGGVEITSLLCIMAHNTAIPHYGSVESEYERYLRNQNLSCIVVNDPNSPAATIATELNIPVLLLFAENETKAGAFHFEKAVQPILDGPIQDDPARIPLIIHTSGTRSDPKRVKISNNNLSAIINNSRHSFQLDTSDRLLSTFERIHISGVVTVMAALAAGGSVYCTRGLKPKDFPQTLEVSQATWFSTVPTNMQAILNATAAPLQTLAPKHRLKRLRISGMFVPKQLMQDTARFAGRGVEVINAYSMTESGQTAYEVFDKNEGMVPSASTIKIKILSADGRVCNTEEEGEIIVSGPQVTIGYQDPGAESAFTVIEGVRYFRTGDVGYLQDEHLRIVGRMKETIKGPDITTSPLEIEDVLRRHPDVLDAAVFPVENHNGIGEKVTAAIVPKDGTDAGAEKWEAMAADLYTFVSRYLKAEKVPEGIVFVPALPVDPTSRKVQRLRLAATLGLEKGFTGVCYRIVE